MAMSMGTGIHAVALVDRQPLNNIARMTIMALAAALAGTQSMHLASYDESYAIPSEEATRTSLMVQHILINETDICRTADPLGGSYAIEALTAELENAISETIASIEEQGGIVKLIEQGDIQRQIAKQAFEEAQRVETGEKVVIGVNKYAVEEDRSKYEEGIFQVDPEIAKAMMTKIDSKNAKKTAEFLRVYLTGSVVGAVPDQEAMGEE
jgi:methylmalonyl-CoA mutase N-terminal domain/subunit